MNTEEKVKTYLPDGHEAHAETLQDAFYLAQSEFLAPYPSTSLKNFSKLNLMTGGLRSYEFSILCGATGTGKTTLCANIALDLIEQGIPHFVASVETGHTDFVKRAISAKANEDWNTGDPVSMLKLKIFNETTADVFKNCKSWLSLYDNRAKIESLMADIAYMVHHNKVKVAIIDNLNFFMEVTSAANQVIEMDRVIHELIIFCKRVPVHIIMVMHPKKTDGGRVESEFDVKGSSTAVQEAHNIFLFNRPHPELIKNGVASDRDRELKIAKMRRRGKFVGKRIILQTRNGVTYTEGEIL